MLGGTSTSHSKIGRSRTSRSPGSGRMVGNSVNCRMFRKSYSLSLNMDQGVDYRGQLWLNRRYIGNFHYPACAHIMSCQLTVHA